MTHSTSPQRQVPVLPQSQVHLPWHNHNHICSNPSFGTATPMKHINSSTSSGTATPVNSFPTAHLHSHSLDALQTHYTMHPQPPSNAYTPQESFEIVSRAGVKKAHMRIEKSFLSACSGGMILSFACATLISTHTSPWYQENAPGLIKTIAALVFPYGLVIVQMTGSDLCTGSFMYTTVAALHRRLSVWRMLQHWGITFLGNLAGSLFVCCVIVGYGGLFEGDLYREESLHFAYKKQVAPEWHQIFLRGIGANWLVCLACFLGMSGRDYVSKVVGIWWPTFAFVSLGFDHVVANMFLIPNAIFLGSTDISIGLYIWKGIVPSLLGNIIGGGLFVGVLYWYLHLQGQGDINIDGHRYESMTRPAQDMGRWVRLKERKDMTESREQVNREQV